MDTVLVKLLCLLRPRIGWLQFTLGLAALLCASAAAGSARLPLPSGSFMLAAVLGFTIALRLGRLPAAPWPNRAFRAVWVAALLLALLAVGALLVVLAAEILPPRGLIAQDLAAYAAWLWAGLRGAAAPTAEARALPFLATALARFWSNLLAAPSGGEAGARLIVLVGGLATTWLAALLLGWALARERALLPWAMPALAATTTTALLGGSSGVEIAFALALVLLLLLANTARRRERSWDARGADYSNELGRDAIAWGACCVMLVIVLAEIIPTTVSNPLADFFWRDVELPSGVAVLERNIPRPQRSSSAQIGISTLPALPLGVSLEKAPPGKVILRIHTSAPLPAGPWPRYWRARVFNFYTGRDWTTNARIGDFTSVALAPTDVPGSILEEIEDLRDDRTIVVGMPDIVTTDLAATAERLPDGSLAALTTGGNATRYQVISRPQEQAIPPRLDTIPPDMSSFLALPSNYSQRVLDLAQVVAGGRASAYERALALEAYLRGLPYAYAVQPVPTRGDAVEQFLFDMQQGYCTYYASAMAVMARSLGIPARLAIGYATGEFDATSNTYLVRQADAHAWVELYIDGRWLPFEPTPIRPLPARGGGEPEFPTPVPVAPAPAEARDTSGPWIWAGTLALVAALSAALWWRGRPRQPRALALDIQAQLERGGARAGIPWPPGATLREYGRLLAPQAGEPPTLDEMTDLLGAARYSGQPLPATREQRLRALAERVLARLAQLRRR